MVSVSRGRQLLRVGLLVAGMAASLAACATVNGQESAKQYVSDASITAKVKADIIKEQSLKGFEIHVETMDRTVQLSGFVDTPAQRMQAGEIARSVEGVQKVDNNIHIREPKGTS